MVFSSSKEKKYRKALAEQERLYAESQASRDLALQREKKLQDETDRRNREEFEHQQHLDEIRIQEKKDADQRRWLEEQHRLQEEGRLNMQMARLRNTSAESIRRMRELIRMRYQLDVEVWGLRDVHRGDQPEVMEKGRRADAILQEIYAMVDTWEESTFTREEWKVAKSIKEQILLPNKRIWEKNPPWN